MKIRFTESRWLDTEDRTKVPKFKEGSTHDLSEASAYRWTRRGFAVYVVEDAPPTLKVDRPMMAEKRVFKPAEISQVFSADMPTKPKKVGRPKKSA